MASTKVQIISNAVTQLGHAPVVSLIDQDELVVAAEQAYDMLLPSVLSQGNWRFATKISQLSQLVEVAPQPYLYVYQLPSGWLKTLSVWPNTYDWDIFNNEKIYTFQNTSWYMQYIYQPDVSHLPPWFVNYFVYEISAYLALSNAEKTEYYSVLESKRIQMQALAHGVETQNRPQFTQVDFPVLGNRYIGGVYPNSIS
jgi:hypothetical protein